MFSFIESPDKLNLTIFNAMLVKFPLNDPDFKISVFHLEF